MIVFYLLATALAACAGFLNFFEDLAFLNSFGLLECVSAALLVFAAVGFKKKSPVGLLSIYISSIIVAVSAATLVCYLAKGASDILLPINLLYISQALAPYFISIPITICLTTKRDPITTALIAICALSVFVMTTNCLSIFVTYDHFGFDAFEFYIADINNEYMKMYGEQNMGVLAQKVFVSFMTRASVSLLPGIFIMLSVVQVFASLFILRILLKDRIKEFHKGPWAVSLSTASAIINIVCIVVFMSSFFTTSVTVLSAVAGNVMLILAPASIILGFAFLIIGFHKGGFFNVVCSALPILMLIIAPPLAIIYISFIGSSSLIFSRIAAAIFKIKQ